MNLNILVTKFFYVAAAGLVHTKHAICVLSAERIHVYVKDLHLSWKNSNGTVHIGIASISAETLGQIY